MADSNPFSHPRIAIGGILTECNHLGGLPIDMQVYESSELLRDEQILQQTTSVVGGMVTAVRQGGGEAVPLIFASACAAGPINRDCYDLLKAEWFERLQAALPLEGVLLPLHGSALVEGMDDPEGDMITAARRLVGPDVPIIITLDLHAHVTHEMVTGADAILAWETYPHHDQFQTGQRAAALMFDVLAGRCRPTMAMAKVPVITSAIHGSTNDEDPFALLMHHAKSLEQRAGVLSTSLFLIHPYMDCHGMGSGGLVVTDNNLPLAEELAADLAMRYWGRRHDLEPESFVPQEAILRGMRVPGGPVILVEAADCCGGGAAGDSIATLSALVDHRPDVPSVCPVVDPAAAAACHEAGEGAELTLSIGHQLDRRWGRSREFSGRVERLCAGRFVYTGGQWEGHEEHMGPTAVFRIQDVRVLLTSRATYDWSDEQLRCAGLDPVMQKFIVAKNPMNYRLAYGEVAKAMIILDTPGPTPPTLKHVEFAKLQRPWFPLDDQIPGLKPTVLSGRSRS